MNDHQKALEMYAKAKRLAESAARKALRAPRRFADWFRAPFHDPDWAVMAKPEIPAPKESGDKPDSPFSGEL